MANALALKEIPFESIIDVVKSLPPDKKMRLHDILDKGWQDEFDRAIVSIRAKMSKFTSEEIDTDINDTLAEVRGCHKIIVSRRGCRLARPARRAT